MSAVPTIFSERRRRARHARAMARQGRPDAAHWLIDAMAEDVIERLGFLRWEGGEALISGLGADRIAAGLGLEPKGAGLLDFHQPIAGGPYDLIVSLGELDTVNDLPGALIYLRHMLAPGGLLLAVILGAGSVPVLRAAMLAGDGDRAAPRIHPQIEGAAASGLLQRAGFVRQVVDTHRIRARFASVFALIGDLRDQGLTSILAQPAPSLTKQAITRIDERFAQASDADGKTSETFELVTLTAWKD